MFAYGRNNDRPISLNYRDTQMHISILKDKLQKIIYFSVEMYTVNCKIYSVSYDSHCSTTLCG